MKKILIMALAVFATSAASAQLRIGGRTINVERAVQAQT